MLRVNKVFVAILHAGLVGAIKVFESSETLL